MRVSVLGMGAMGSRIARRVAAAGHELRVWSRSDVPADLASSARPTLHDAVLEADVVLAMVTDDDASRAVWSGASGALAGMRDRALAIECSTLTPDWVTELAASARDRGVRFLDAPVVGSRPQAEQGALVVLASGDAADVESARAVFSSFASAVHSMGATPRATIAKLATNALFAAQVAVLGELLAAVADQGIEPAAMLELLGALPVLSPAARGAGLAMVAERFEPMFPVALVAKDLRYALRSKSRDMPVIDCVRERYERAVASGLGEENITAVAKLSRA
ncbi:MAG: NAD(P)-dependent oxidoreductase [Polyangiaceae bacterium]|nr:NAD(P)-dependent oxidoreductase [Polyangiaceae bacterium]